MDRPHDRDDAKLLDDRDEGGSEVCLLRRVCPACGHLHEGRLPDVCARCGADLPE